MKHQSLQGDAEGVTLHLPDDHVYSCLRPRSQRGPISADRPPIPHPDEVIERYLRPVTIRLAPAVRRSFVEYWMLETCYELQELDLSTFEDFEDVRHVVEGVGPQLVALATAESVTLPAAAFVDFVLRRLDELADPIKHVTWPPNPPEIREDYDHDDLEEARGQVDGQVQVLELLYDVEDALDGLYQVARAA